MPKLLQPRPATLTVSEPIRRVSICALWTAGRVRRERSALRDFNAARKADIEVLRESRKTSQGLCRPHCASAFEIAARKAGSSGVTALGKNASTFPSLPTTYFEKFHLGRFPDFDRNPYTGDCSVPWRVTTFSNIGNVTP